MKIEEIKFRGSQNKYSVLIGKNVLNILGKKVRFICPKTRKIALIIDSKVPSKFKSILKKSLKNYEILLLSFHASEKSKSFNIVQVFLNKLLVNNFNRSDLIISVGGGITGDVVGFTASIFKRGINFINIPTTLLAQVDSAIGGKTGINSHHGKNLIGTFYQPRLVIIDTILLNSLPKKEIICGYAEILKHSIIKDKVFFNWLEKNTKYILNKSSIHLIYAIKKSCKIKMYFVDKDVSEKNLRMTLNFGHTFAHAIEAKNKFSKKITHGEAVLSGIILASKLSVIKKICDIKTFLKIKKIYITNNLAYTYKKFRNKSYFLKIIPFLKNDKKNNDEKINFILLKKIGRTDLPDKNKLSLSSLKKLSGKIIQY